MLSFSTSIIFLSVAILLSPFLIISSAFSALRTSVKMPGIFGSPNTSRKFPTDDVTINAFWLYILLNVIADLIFLFITSHWATIINDYLSLKWKQLLWHIKDESVLRFLKFEFDRSLWLFDEKVIKPILMLIIRLTADLKENGFEHVILAVYKDILEVYTAVIYSIGMFAHIEIVLISQRLTYLLWEIYLLSWELFELEFPLVILLTLAVCVHHNINTITHTIATNEVVQMIISEIAIVLGIFMSELWEWISNVLFALDLLIIKKPAFAFEWVFLFLLFIYHVIYLFASIGLFSMYTLKLLTKTFIYTFCPWVLDILRKILKNPTEIDFSMFKILFWAIVDIVEVPFIFIWYVIRPTVIGLEIWVYIYMYPLWLLIDFFIEFVKAYVCSIINFIHFTIDCIYAIIDCIYNIISSVYIIIIYIIDGKITLDIFIEYFKNCIINYSTHIAELAPLLTIFLPLSSAFIILLFSRFFGKKGALTLNLISLTISLSLLIFMFLHQNEGLPFFNYSSSKIGNTTKIWVDFLQNWELHFDFITLTMCFLVTIVSLLVNFYAYNYLLTDPHLTRFFSYLNFFTFFMLFLVSSNNLIQFFFAWEGVGICSYLLIGFWSTRLQAVKSAIKAVLLNKIGDFCLLFAIAYSWSLLDICSFTQFKQIIHISVLQFSTGLPLILGNQQLMSISLSIIALFFIFAAVAKSAQIGLHTWLPDAMEGPTPVSALIHAATMVTAGILLILRISPILTDLIYILYFILILGAFTAIMSGFIACFQTDLKKIIAYSTCSQLGYMFFACGASLYSVSLLHLISHGFFKALLFLVAGSFIHMSTNEQASNKIYFFENIKLTSLYTIVLYVGLTSLTALPFFSGFYSKEAILLLSLNNYWGGAWLSGSIGFTFGILAALLTTIYSASMLEELIYINPKKLRSNLTHKFIPLSTKVALILLGCFSVFFGYYLATEWLGKYNNIFNVDHSFNFLVDNFDWLTISLSLSTEIFSLPLILELLPLISGIFFTAISRANILSFIEKYAFILYTDILKKNLAPKTYIFFCNLKIIAQNKFWFDYLINNCASLVQKFSYFYLFKKLDKGLLERIGPTFLTNQVWLYNFFTRFFNYNIVLEGLLLILSAICFYFYFIL